MWNFAGNFWWLTSWKPTFGASFYGKSSCKSSQLQLHNGSLNWPQLQERRTEKGGKVCENEVFSECGSSGVDFVILSFLAWSLKVMTIFFGCRERTAQIQNVLKPEIAQERTHYKLGPLIRNQLQISLGYYLFVSSHLKPRIAPEAATWTRCKDAETACWVTADFKF